MADDGITVQLKGDKDCVAAFKELREFVRGNPFRQAVRAAAELMLQEIYQRIPVRTGKLVSNLRIVTKRTAATIRARIVINMAGKAEDKNNAFYWRFLEFGHRTREDGGIGFVAPRPFITPAFESAREPSAQTVLDTFEAGLNRAEARAKRAGAI
jgi:HK97 gp10 family phage protein